MLNIKVDSLGEFIKVMFVNGSDINLEEVCSIVEDESGYLRFKDYYGDDLFVANGRNIIGWVKR